MAARARTRSTASACLPCAPEGTCEREFTSRAPPPRCAAGATIHTTNGLNVILKHRVVPPAPEASSANGSSGNGAFAAPSQVAIPAYAVNLALNGNGNGAHGNGNGAHGNGNGAHGNGNGAQQQQQQQQQPSVVAAAAAAATSVAVAAAAQPPGVQAAVDAAAGAVSKCPFSGLMG